MVGLVAGCSNPSTSPTSGTSQSDGKQSSSTPPAGVTVVYEPFANLWREQVQYDSDAHNAIERLTVSCMKEKGFSYTPLPYKERTLEIQTYGDIATAQREGFGIVLEIRNKKEAPVNPDIKGMTEQQQSSYSEALLGKPIGPDKKDDPDIATLKRPNGDSRLRKSGCLNVARAKISGTLETWMMAQLQLEDLANQVRDETVNDPQFIAAESTWKHCMDSAGLGSLSKQAHIDKLHDNLTSGKVTLDGLESEEIRIATASAQCEQDANLGQAVSEVQARIEKNTLDKNQAFVISWNEAHKAAGQRAKEYLDR